MSARWQSGREPTAVEKKYGLRNEPPSPDGRTLAEGCRRTEARLDDGNADPQPWVGDREPGSLFDRLLILVLFLWASGLSVEGHFCHAEESADEQLKPWPGPSAPAKPKPKPQEGPKPDPCVATCTDVAARNRVCNAAQLDCSDSLAGALKACTGPCDILFEQTSRACKEAYDRASSDCDRDDPSLSKACKNGPRETMRSCTAGALTENEACWGTCRRTEYSTSECSGMKKTCKAADAAAKAAKGCSC